MAIIRWDYMQTIVIQHCPAEKKIAISKEMSKSEQTASTNVIHFKNTFLKITQNCVMMPCP